MAFLWLISTSFFVVTLSYTILYFFSMHEGLMTIQMKAYLNYYTYIFYGFLTCPVYFILVKNSLNNTSYIQMFFLGILFGYGASIISHLIAYIFFFVPGLERITALFFERSVSAFFEYLLFAVLLMGWLAGALAFVLLKAIENIKAVIHAHW